MRGRKAGAGDIAAKDLAAVRVQVRDGTQQQTLAGAGGAGQEHQLAGVDAKLHGLQQMRLQGLDAQCGHGGAAASAAPVEEVEDAVPEPLAAALELGRRAARGRGA
jgi:hypothetical protein